MKSILTVLFAICFLSAQPQSGAGQVKFNRGDTLRGDLSEMRLCYDVLFYDLDIKVDIEKKFLSGANTIRFLVVNDFKTFQIDLFKNMNIEKIVFNKQDVLFRREFNAVFVEFPDTIRKGNTASITVHYSGKPIEAKNAPWDGGFSWSRDKRKKPFVGVSCQGTGASLWWPCKDHQSDEPNEMMIRITVPPGLKDVSNGKLLREIALPDGWTKFEWYVSYPINNYDVTLNIANYVHFGDSFIHAGYKDTLSLDYYVLPENLEKARKQFEQVKPMMDCYYGLFGEYPFLKDGYKLVEAPYLGMEHQSCIAYGNKYRNGYLGIDMSGTGNRFDYIIIHESAHEWWGNSITTTDIADMWIHEGFTTYSEALYVECLYGYDSYIDYINSEKSKVQNDEPMVGKWGLNNEGSGDMYPKGALVIHTIRSIMNDEVKFFKMLREIQVKFRYKTITSHDVESFISQYAGLDLSEVFDLYLRTTMIPELVIEYERDRTDLVIYYFYNMKGRKGFDMPVQITIEKNKYELIFPDSKRKKIILKDMKVEDFKIATELFYLNTKLIDLDQQGSYQLQNETE
ncbi:MAG: M1 family metallopeptidase [Bacteroidota bacterium]|nr:M1 family metallopeptidase [Bacteroidota bacterium]